MLIKKGVLKKVTDVDIKDGTFVFSKEVTVIGEYAFECCKSLTHVVIPDSVTEIGGFAFSECENLIHVVILNSICKIGAYAFHDCVSLTSIDIPNSVSVIELSAFDNCKKLTIVKLPNSVTFIGNQAFWNCTNLKSVVIPDSVTEIGDYAFEGCKNLTDVVIPQNVKTIGIEAFYGCVSLASLTIQGIKHKTVCADGYIAFIEHSKKTDKYTIHKAKQLEYMQDGEIFSTDCYIAEQNEVYAHGDTVKEAVEDLQFKQAKNRGQEQYSNVDVNTQIAFADAKNMYRVITGACQKGTKMFLNTLKTVKNTYSVKEICTLTAGQYGNTVFCRFFGL